MNCQMIRRHLVAIELDDGVLHLDLAHAWAPRFDRWFTELPQRYLDIKILLAHGPHGESGKRALLPSMGYLTHSVRRGKA
jgi:hypothetical protein